MYASRLSRIPYVVYVRDVVRNWFSPDGLRALQRSDRVITNSQWIANRCQLANIAEEYTKVIYPPIDVNAFQQVSQIAVKALRETFHVSENQIAIGIVGQIHPLKGQLEFVQAAIQVASVIPHAIFFVVGSSMTSEQSSFAEYLKTLVLEAGLNTRFHFTGFRDDITVFLHLCDIVVVSSSIEAFGRVVVESMAAGCSVIGVNSGGIPEIIEHNVDGLLVPAQNIRALTDAIIQLCSDPVLRTSLGCFAVEKAKQFSIPHHIAEMKALYDSLL
jgi:glycosyltransferase involved in cell wall biosynthesis